MFPPHPRSRVSRILALFVLLAAWASACRTSAVGADEGRDYVLVILRRGPQSAGRAPEEVQRVQAAHMANITRLAEAHVLFVAGPFGTPNPDPSRRGLFVFDVADVERARELTASDPAVQEGVLTMELIPLRMRADLRRAHELDMQLLAKGDEPDAAPFPMHAYTFAIVGGGERAHAALERSIAPGGVLAVGELGGAAAGSSMVWLDAPDRERAEALLAPVRADLGTLDLTPWWASATLLELAAWSANTAR